MSRFRSGRIAAAAAACAFALPAIASTVLVDFENQAAGTLFFDGDSFAQRGYSLTVGGSFGDVDTADACFIAACPSGDATQLYLALNDSHLLLARTDGTAFQLGGFDAGFLAPAPLPDTAPGEIRLHAVHSDGSTVDVGAAFAASGPDGSFAFAAYGSLGLGWVTSIDFYACTFDNAGQCRNPNGNQAQFALDNIVLSAVPEPASALLAGLGLTALWARGRRRAAADEEACA